MSRNYYVEYIAEVSSLSFLPEENSEVKKIKIIILEAGNHILYFGKLIRAIKILWGEVSFMKNNFKSGQTVSVWVCGLLEGLEREVTCSKRSIFCIEY